MQMSSQQRSYFRVSLPLDFALPKRWVGRGREGKRVGGKGGKGCLGQVRKGKEREVMVGLSRQEKGKVW